MQAGVEEALCLHAALEPHFGRHMDAMREWMESDPDVIMVGTWMLCGMDGV